MKEQKITLIITHNCNLRCSYCYVNDYSEDKNMSFDTAKDIITNTLKNNNETITDFIFFGGEPFLNFELMKKVCEWTWKNFPKEKYCFSATTNGTMLNQDIKLWLTKNKKRISLGLSYDGSEMSQNTNRCQSNSKIDLDFFKKNYPKQSFKMTISKETLPTIAQDIINLREKGFLVNDTLSSDIENWDENDLKIFEQQLNRLCDYELSCNSKFPSRFLTLPLHDVIKKNNDKTFNCGAGKINFTYDYDGKKYPCHLLSPLVLTKKQSEQFVNSNIKITPEAKCQECFLQNICSVCDAMSYIKFGTYGKRLKNTCELFKIQIKYSCKFQAKKILRKKRTSKQDKITLTQIKYIMQNLLKEAVCQK